MTRFYFDIVRNGRDDGRDCDGVEMPDLAAAQREAVQAVLAIASDEGLTECACMLRDAGGTVLHVVTMRLGSYAVPVDLRVAA